MGLAMDGSILWHSDSMRLHISSHNSAKFTRGEESFRILDEDHNRASAMISRTSPNTAQDRPEVLELIATIFVSNVRFGHIYSYFL